MGCFASRLISWQRAYGRHDLPWQHADVYRVWLSEVMLQQTQVATVIPYYQRFIVAFPTITDLAAANEDQVLSHWSGLGYYARARNLHRAAKIIAAKYHGEFPRLFDQIMELPGIGRSTAGAICALAWNERRAILDGNVKRVLARHFGIVGSIREKRIEAELWQKANSLLPHRNVGCYIQAQMDLGATICTYRKPKCTLCPLRSDCVTFQSGAASAASVAKAGRSIRYKDATLLLLIHGKEILLEKRPPNGIWGGLWALPQFEDEPSARTWFEKGRMVATQGERLGIFTHSLTHLRLRISPLKIQLQCKPFLAASSSAVWMSVVDALAAAIPTPVRILIESHCRS